MFEVFCGSHGCRVLLDHSRVESLRNTADGPVLDWRCWCGTRGSLAPGRGADEGAADGPTADGPTADEHRSVPPTQVA